MGPDPHADPHRTVAAGPGSIDATTHYKLCPRCKAPAHLHATECANTQCRRPFRTQFAGTPASATPPEPTVYAAPRPPDPTVYAAPPPDPTVQYSAPPRPDPALYSPAPPAAQTGTDPPPAGSGPRVPVTALAVALVLLVVGIVAVGYQLVRALRPPAAAVMPAVPTETTEAAEPDYTAPSAPAEPTPIAPASPAAKAPADLATANVPPVSAVSGTLPPVVASPGPGFTATNAPAPSPVPNGPETAPATANGPFPAPRSARKTPPVAAAPTSAPRVDSGLPPSTLLSSGARIVGETRPTLPCGHPLGQVFDQPEHRIKRAFCTAGDMFIRKGKRWVRP